MLWLLLAIAFVAGGFLPLQAGINARLAQGVGSPALAALVSFSVGTAALALYASAARIPLPAASALAAAPWWLWAGGLLGALYVTLAAALAHPLGSAVLVGVTVAGQMATSLLLDHYGLVGFAARPVTPLRLAGALLIVGGVALIRRF